MPVITARSSTPALLIAPLVSACGGGNESTESDPIVCNTLSASPLEEGFSGEFSDAPSNPDLWNLGARANELIAGTVAGDLDYVTFAVGNCDTLDSIVVNAYTSNAGDDIAFVAIQRGESFTVTAETANARLDELYGYRHFGTADIGVDILAEIGQANSAEGFTSPLPAGNYTLWLNQVGPLSEYTLGFNVSRVSE